MAAKFTLGLYQPAQKILNIQEVSENQRRDFICLICKNPLTCVQKSGKVALHFKHRNQNVKCNPTLETLLHKAAKKIICGTNKILLPDHRKIFTYHEAQEEIQWMDYRPDVTLTTYDKPIYVEIIVSNPISKDKKLAYRQHKADCLVIDLSDYPALFEMKALERDVLLEPRIRFFLPQYVNFPTVTTQKNNLNDIILLTAVVAAAGCLYYKTRSKNKKKPNRRRRRYPCKATSLQNFRH